MKIQRTWASTVLRVEERLFGHRLVGSAFGHKLQDLPLPVAEILKRRGFRRMDQFSHQNLRERRRKHQFALDLIGPGNCL